MHCTPRVRRRRPRFLNCKPCGQPETPRPPYPQHPYTPHHDNAGKVSTERPGTVCEGHSSVGWMQASRADTRLTAERELPPGRHQPGGEARTRQAAAGAPAPRALQEVHVLTKWAVRRPQPRTTSKNTEVSVFTNRHSCDQPLTSPADQTGIIYGINGRKQ